MTDSMTRQLLHKLMHQRQYHDVGAVSNLMRNNGYTLIVNEYAGDVPRLMKRDNFVYLLCPKNITYVQEAGIADSIENGTIFDDAEFLDDHADYVQKTVLPMNAIINKHGVEPKKLRVIIGGVVGRIGDDGTIEITLGDMKNGENFVRDISTGTGCEHVNKMCDHYLGMDYKDPDNGHATLPTDIKRDIADLIDEIDSITDIDPDDELTDEDFELIGVEEAGDETYSNPQGGYGGFEAVDESYHQESFFTRHPKKLKPIPRDVVSYITVEINAIQDSNDQAMLAGYTSAKLELVDFYLNCIDTKDDRYVVPHTRQYLVQMQNELNALLRRILQIRPVNKMDRMWRGIL